MCIFLQPDKGRTVRLVAWLGALKEQIQIYGPRVLDHK